MKSGTLRHYVRIWAMSPPDAFGSGRAYDMPVGGPDYADIQPVTGREHADTKLMSEVDCKIIMRFRPDVTSAMVVRHPKGSGTVEYQIKAVIDEDYRERKLILLCRRVDG